MEKLAKKLYELKKDFNIQGIKIEFESEYLTKKEQDFLKKTAEDYGIIFAIKLGGFSSFKDIFEAKKINTDEIIAPMIETPYALQKFIDTLEAIYGSENKPKLFISLETKSAIQNIDEIFNSPYLDKIEGIVFGRGDFIKSFEIDDVEDKKVLQIARLLRDKTLQFNKKMTIGGKITAKSAKFLNEIKPDFTETRKIIFKGTPSEVAIENAIEFEKNLISLKENKTQSDYSRIEKLQKRLTISRFQGV